MSYIINMGSLKTFPNPRPSVTLVMLFSFLGQTGCTRSDSW